MNGFVIEGRGGGGKGGGGGGATEAADTLKSTQIADIIDVISEGECEGLIGGPKGVFLDGVPLQNADDSFNFTGVDLAWTAGTQGQAALPGIDSVRNEVGVNVAVTQATPVVRTITSPSVDKCQVTISVPRLSSQDMSTGNITGSQFDYAIDVQSNGGGYVQVFSGTVQGKTNSKYTRSVAFELPGSAPWDIRVRRITADSVAGNVTNSFSWFSFTEIQSVKLRYPNTALVRMRIDAEQFSNVPARTFDWGGLRIKVPTNYDPVNRSYAGTWDGTFKIAWTDNPAWIYYDMATSKRYGLGEFIDASQVNKWALYAIGQYCDEQVPNGSGTTEPRFRCNVQFRDRVEAFKLMQELASTFRGMAFHSGSTLEVFQDAPSDTSLIYTPANVIDGNFAYEDSSEKSLHSVFICYWFDMEQQGKKVPEVYAPSDLIQRYGLREIELTPMGVTSRGQAARLARWARHSEQMEGSLVTFEVGTDGIVAAPGKVFAISDPNVAGDRLSGRIKSATSSVVTLDAPVTLQGGEVYTLTVLQPDPGSHMGYITQERTVTTAAGSVSSLTVSPSFSGAPVAGTVWMLQSTGIASTMWRCLAVEEVPNENRYRISGVAHNPSKYDAIELGLTLDEPIVTRLKTEASPPTELDLVEEIYTDGTVNKSALTVSFVPSEDARRHRISYRQDTSWWVDLPDTSEQCVTIRGLDPGVYEVVVRSINGLGNVSPAVTGSIALAGGKSGVRAVRLKSSSLTFKVPTTGISTPSSITITADTGALDEAGLAWTVTGGTLTGTGATRTLTYANMSADLCSVTASVTDGGATFSDTLTLIKVYDGAQGSAGAPGAAGTPGATGPTGAPAVSASVTLDSIGLPADAAGAVTSYSGASSSMVVFLGGTVDTTNWTFSHTATDVTVTRATNTVTITAMAAGVTIGYVDITATRAGYASITKRVTVSKYKTGAAGAAGLNATSYWMTSTAPAVQKSVAGAYTPAAVTVSLFSATGGGAPSAYAGRLIIATSADGSTFSDAYTSAANESSKSFTVPGGIKAIRFRAYAAGGTTTLLDEEISTIVSDGATGATGANAISATCSNEAHTLPANTDGMVTSYSGSGCVIRVLEGAAELTYDGTGTANGTWKVTAAATNITTGSLTDSGAFVTVGAHSAALQAQDTASITYTITGKSTAGIAFTLTKQQTFSKAKAGRRGSVQLAATTTGTTWSDSAANAAILAAGYTEVVDRDVVTLVNAGASWSEARVSVSGAWLTLNAFITGNLLVDGTIAAQKMAVSQLSAISANLGTVTAGTLSAGTVFAGALNAATGTFAGSLSAATGTFAGGLSAATGTFAGNLTADAIEAVDTINIKGNAITVPTSAEWSGIENIPDTTWTTIVTTPSSNFGGGSVQIIATLSGVAGGLDTEPPRIRVLRDGAVVLGDRMGWKDAYKSGYVPPCGAVTVVMDTPGVGNHTYTVQAYGKRGTVSPYHRINSASIVVLGVKK